MLARTLFVILVGLALYKSFQVTGSISQHSHWTDLAEKKKCLKSALATSGSAANPLLKQKLAEALWQEKNFNEAEQLLSERWLASKSINQSGYNPDTVQLALQLATLCLDQGAFEKAIHYYNFIRTYDNDKLGTANSLAARDLNNLGIASYLAGKTCQDLPQRQAMFSKAISFFSQAAEIGQRSGAHDDTRWQLERILSNRELVIRDLIGLPQQPFDRRASPNNRMI